MSRPKHLGSIDRHLARAAILAACAALGACGGARSDPELATAARDDAPVDRVPSRTPVGTTVTSATEADAGPPCASHADCPENQMCQSPEEATWNFCGPPHQANCAPGHVGDSCGHCFRACSAETPCEAPMTCNGAYCISARRCQPFRTPPQ